MFDLQTVANETYEVKWLDGSVLKLHKPTRAMELSFLQMREEHIDEKQAQTIFYNLMFRIFERREDVYIEKKGLLNKLRNKKELIVITEEEIEKIPYDALFAILQEYFDFYYKSLKMGE